MRLVVPVELFVTRNFCVLSSSCQMALDTMSPNAVQNILSVELKQAKSPIVIALGVLGSAHFDIGRDILHCTSYTSRLYRVYHIIAQPPSQSLTYASGSLPSLNAL